MTTISRDSPALMGRGARKQHGRGKMYHSPAYLPWGRPGRASGLHKDGETALRDQGTSLMGCSRTDTTRGEREQAWGSTTPPRCGTGRGTREGPPAGHPRPLCVTLRESGGEAGLILRPLPLQRTGSVLCEPGHQRERGADARWDSALRTTRGRMPCRAYLGLYLEHSHSCFALSSVLHGLPGDANGTRPFEDSDCTTRGRMPCVP